MFDNIKDTVKELISSILTAIIFVFIFNFFTGFTTVQGVSMEPTLHTGDKLVINKIDKLTRNIERGDIIVFDSTPGASKSEKIYFIKRVIGIAGDKIEIKNGDVFVNGVEIDESYADKLDSYTNLTLTVPEDSYFVLGDNRDKSNDSRYFGTILHSQVSGSIFMQVFPKINFNKFK